MEMGTIDTISAPGWIGSSGRLIDREPVRRTNRAADPASRLLQWLEKRRSRRALASLTREALIDIGLSAEDVTREVSKSFFLW
jgi:uncharacterized protein YjiS (DUF1127 family)